MTASGQRYDAIIVGSGAAGSLFAARFAEAGRRVLVLEAGPAWNLGDLASSQIWARRLKWGGAPVERGGADPFGHNLSTGWGLGGAALHHFAGWPRLHPEDFRTRALYGRAVDWPLDYAILRPHYDRIQAECGISGDADRETWRPEGAPYPMPPLATFRQAEILARGFAALGLRTAPAPLAINSTPYKGRAPCLNDGWCDAGCPILALANPLVLHIPAARAAGATFLTESTVTRVLTNARGAVDGVRYVSRDGRVTRACGDLVVLAAAPVQNVRLLLASTSERAPRGLGNSRGLVGRRFVCHTVVNVYGLFDEDTDNHLGVSAGPLISQDGYRKNSRSGAFGSYQWGLAPAIKPNDLLGIANTRADLWGHELHAFMRRAARGLAAMSALCETLPHDDNRIVLTSRKDSHGVPLAKIEHSLDADAKALAAHATAEGLRVMEAAGASERWPGIVAMAHPLGGTPMGDDPATSVTDSHGRVHGVGGLVIAGGGLFPTAGGGSPTFTILALADRAANHLLAAAGQ